MRPEMRKEDRMEDETKPRSSKEDKPLEKLTVKDLREIALGIPHEHTEIAVSDMKKAELIEFIKSARGIEEKAPAGKKTVKVKAKTKRTKTEIKDEIRSLRTDRQSARDSGEKNRARLIRRRINRLKKLTRKTV
jgi:hypothetical protein